jgi:hypothetical protein
MGDGFFAVPIALELVAVLVEAAASVTVGQLVRIVVLKGIILHGVILQLSESAGVVKW